MQRVWLGRAATVVALLCWSCESKPKGPVGLKWDSIDVTFVDAPGETLYISRPSVSLEEANLVLRWSLAPPGAKVTLAGKTIEGMALIDWRTSVMKELLAIPPVRAFDRAYKHDFAIPIVFVVNGHSFATKLPPVEPWHALQAFFGKVKSGAGIPLERKRAAGHAAVLFAEMSTKLFGTAPTLAEVDWIAYQSRLEPQTSTKLCGPYRTMGAAADKRSSLVLRRVDFVAELYERATGKLIEKKVFAAPDECPDVTAVVNSTAESYPPPNVVDEWLKQRVEMP